LDKGQKGGGPSGPEPRSKKLGGVGTAGEDWSAEVAGPEKCDRIAGKEQGAVEEVKKDPLEGRRGNLRKISSDKLGGAPGFIGAGGRDSREPALRLTLREFDPCVERLGRQRWGVMLRKLGGVTGTSNRTFPSGKSFAWKGEGRESSPQDPRDPPEITGGACW